MSVLQERGRLASRLAAILDIDPAAPAIEYDGEWWSWGRIAESAAVAAALVAEPGAPVGVILRNTPQHVAAVLGVLLAEGCLVTMNPSLGPERIASDLGALEIAALLGSREDLDRLAGSYDAAPVMVLSEALPRPREGSPTPSPAVTARPGVAVLMLTSGTTGPPKRIELGADLLVRTFQGAKHYESGQSTEPVLRRGVAVVNSPLVHLSGVFRILQCVLDGRSFALLPRFEVERWADAVRRHRPKTASLVPAALRMVLDSDLTREDLSSLLSVTSGTAPLDPADVDAFQARFGVPVLTSYAATEFGGGVAGWNLADFREHWTAKRGSVGRAHAGCGLRVVDPEAPDGPPLPVGNVGLLEVRAAQLGGEAGWMRTTDLGRLDDDGFLWIVGRADQTIIRGGFKVQPDTVRSALEALPEVRHASVLGLPDERLGQVPVALVELRDGMTATPAQLIEASRPALASYEVPVHLQVVPVLPRTASGKVDLTAARALVVREETA